LTTLLALCLIAAVLVVMLYPLYVRRPVAQVAEGLTPLELEEHYRSALADLQDTELDWQVGNLSEADYHRLRDHYRQRAAELLRELDLRASLRAAVVEEMRGTGAIPAQAVEAGAAVAAPVGVNRGPLRVAIVGVSIAVIAVGAIAALYARLASVQAAQAPLATLPIAHAHVVTIDERGGLWVGHHEGLLRSNDGVAWRAAAFSGDVMAVLSVDDRQIVLGHDVLLESRDGGTSWQALAHNLPGTDVHGAQRGRAGMYAYVVGAGLFRSTDGTTWERRADPLPQEVGALALLPGPDGGDVLFLAAGGSVLRSPDGGRTWASAGGMGNLALSGFVNGLASDPSRGVLYAGSGDGLFRSTSGGSDWTRLPFRGSVIAVGARGDRIAVVDNRGQFFLSVDGGGSWTAGS
jgi:photosystem II stability/assembly factor-like uncharacterized protein